MPLIDPKAQRVNNRILFEASNAVTDVILSGKGQFRQLKLDIFGGKIKLGCVCLNRARPDSTEQHGPDHDPTFVDHVHREPARIDLFQLIDSKHVKINSFEYKGGDFKNSTGAQEFIHDTGPLTDFPSTYTIRVTSKSKNQSKASFGLSGVGSWSFVTGEAVPVRIMNNAFRLAIQALGISGRAEGDKIHLRFGAELEDFLRLDSVILGEHVIDLPNKVDLDAFLTRFDGKICSTDEVVGIINDRFKRDQAVLEARFTNPNCQVGRKHSGLKKRKESLRPGAMSR